MQAEREDLLHYGFNIHRHGSNIHTRILLDRPYNKFMQASC